jgi:NAD(P)-dependent dehydrogenase (short-subunit alcohol dehydrogenase family)
MSDSPRFGPGDEALAALPTVFRPDLFAGQVVLVSGAGSGIGRAIALAFAAAGARVALTGRGEAPLSETAALIGGGEVIAADLTDAAQVARAAARGAEALGGPDILVNNAGVNTPRRYTHQLDAAAIRALVDGNLTAPFMTSTAVLPAMRARGGGLLPSHRSWGAQSWRSCPYPSEQCR